MADGRGRGDGGGRHDLLRHRRRAARRSGCCTTAGTSAIRSTSIAGPGRRWRFRASAVPRPRRLAACAAQYFFAAARLVAGLPALLRGPPGCVAALFRKRACWPLLLLTLPAAFTSGASIPRAPPSSCPLCGRTAVTTSATRWPSCRWSRSGCRLVRLAESRFRKTAAAARRRSRAVRRFSFIPQRTASPGRKPK